MTVGIVSVAERPPLFERIEAIHETAWPEFNRHGDVLNRYWGRLASDFACFQFVLFDDDQDAVLAGANSIPIRWDGTVDGLPEGIDAVMEQGCTLAEMGGQANTLSALAIVVPPDQRRAGHSRRMIAAMADLAARQGLGGVVVPLRPVWKDRYPLTSIERYVAWTNDDGLPFDPWLRTHVRVGGRILRPAPESLRITGSVAEWESWTEMRFPDDGQYVIPGGLALLTIDHRADLGSYWEPNVWVGHPVPAPARDT